MSNYKISTSLFPKILKTIVAAVFCFAFSTASKSTTITVAVDNFSFTPSVVSANVGDTIKWQWIGGSHTTTCDGTGGTVLPAGATPWNSPLNSGSTQFLYKLSVSGTYNYICVPHAGSGMTGTLNVTSGASSSLLIENFDYPAGDSLGAHGWVSFSGGSTNVLMVTSPGLTYTGYPLSGIGNATTLALSGQDAYKNFSVPDSTGNLYVSFMVKINTAQSAGDYFFALLPPTSTTLYTARFYAKDSLGGRAFGLSKSTAAAGGIFYTGGNYSYGTTYVVVIKYTFNPGTTTDDVMNAYIFNAGIPSTEPVTPTIGPVSGTASDNTLGRIALRQGTAASSAGLNADGFNVAKTWSGIVTGIKPVSNNISEGFVLNQNYPNPFNPNTTIEFVIPENGFVNLTVYNALGMEVKSLVNENLSSGSYRTNFNGSGLNSGVYFYKLSYLNKEGNNFTATKKLILIK